MTSLPPTNFRTYNVRNLSTSRYGGHKTRRALKEIRQKHSPNKVSEAVRALHMANKRLTQIVHRQIIKMVYFILTVEDVVFDFARTEIEEDIEQLIAECAYTTANEILGKVKTKLTEVERGMDSEDKLRISELGARLDTRKRSPFKRMVVKPITNMLDKFMELAHPQALAKYKPGAADLPALVDNMEWGKPTEDQCKKIGVVLAILKEISSDANPMENQLGRLKYLENNVIFDIIRDAKLTTVTPVERQDMLTFLPSRESAAAPVLELLDCLVGQVLNPMRVLVHHLRHASDESKEDLKKAEDGKLDSPTPPEHWELLAALMYDKALAAENDNLDEATIGKDTFQSTFKYIEDNIVTPTVAKYQELRTERRKRMKDVLKGIGKEASTVVAVFGETLECWASQGSGDIVEALRRVTGIKVHHHHKQTDPTTTKEKSHALILAMVETRMGKCGATIVTFNGNIHGNYVQDKEMQQAVLKRSVLLRSMLESAAMMIPHGLMYGIDKYYAKVRTILDLAVPDIGISSVLNVCECKFNEDEDELECDCNNLKRNRYSTPKLPGKSEELYGGWACKNITKSTGWKQTYDASDDLPEHCMYTTLMKEDGSSGFEMT